MEQARAIEIFWDVENTGCGAAQADFVHALVASLRALRPTATVVRGLACGKLCCFSQPFVDALAQHGIEVAVAPSGKNAADRLIARAMRICLGGAAATEAACAAVLVSGDGGFAPALAPFHDSILLHTANNVSDALVAVAREHYTLESLLMRSARAASGAAAGDDIHTHHLLQQQQLQPPWVAVHVAALYRCGRVGAGKLEYPFYSSVSPSAIARAHREHLGTHINGRPRAFCLTASHWLREVIALNGVLQLYVPTEALFGFMDSELVLAYARDAGWTPLHDWNLAPRERRVGHPVFTQQLLLAQTEELDDGAARAYEAVGRPHPHPELNVLLHVMAHHAETQRTTKTTTSAAAAAARCRHQSHAHAHAHAHVHEDDADPSTSTATHTRSRSCSDDFVSHFLTDSDASDT